MPSGSAGNALADHEPSDARTVLRVCTSWSGAPETGRKILTTTIVELPAATPARPLKLGVGSFVELPSPGSTSVTGGSAEFTIHVSVAGAGSTLPAASIARTARVCEPSASEP